jgi:hypothetical protein
MLGACGKLIVMLSAFDVVCFGLLLSVTDAVKLDVPAGPSGVPVIAPVPLFKLSPGGNDPVLIE